VRHRGLLFLVLLLAFACPAAADPLRLDGPFVQGGLVFGHVEPTATVELDGRPFRVGPDGRFLIGFGRDAAPMARLSVRHADGTIEERDLAVAQRSYDIQRIDGLPPDKVTPSADDLKRIKDDQERIARARQNDTAQPYFASGFVWPAVGTITGVYGSQRILNGEPRQPHYGVDVAAPVGAPVVAPADGVVSFADPNLFFTGATLMIDHGHGLSSTFLHLSEITVRVGERVRQGDLIARAGASGRATGPHLDWRINLFDIRIDPMLVVGPMPEPTLAQ
jgi:murein DD-endopeptidase MepM/ murein hydrolase activator NlpD